MKTLLSFVLLINGWMVADAQSIDQDVAAINTMSQYQAGIHFELINPAWPSDGGLPVVYEFFSYMCPGCFSFEPVMNQLESQSNGDETSTNFQIIKVPVALYPQWEPHAKTYYTLKMMGELDRVHQAFFAAIHQYKKQFRTLDDIAVWLSASFGIDQKSFVDNANSFAVDSMMRKGQQMIKTMGVNRLPTLVVDGKYKPNFDQLKTKNDILGVTLYLTQANQ